MSTALAATTDVVGIAARTKLAVLNKGLWQTTRLNKKETRAENERHNTDAARVSVRVSAHQALKELRQLHDAAYKEHTSLTLPTIEKGLRLLPAGREFEHSERMRKFADRHDALVQAFLADYPREYADAPARLNGLYDPSAWPSPAKMPEKFKFSTRYLPTPTEGSWGEWLAESSRAAEDDLRERLTAALRRVVERCRADGALHVTVFENLRELADLLPDLDLSGQFTPVVQAMAPLTRLHAEGLRDDERGRELAAQKASSILSVLGGIK